MIPLTGFLLLTSYISADVKLGWEKDEAFVNEGKDLKITCILPVTSEFRAIESSSRLLYLVDSPGVNSKRYSKTKVTPSNGRTIIEFFIPKVRGSDSGDYHCRCESKVCNGVVYKFKLNILVLPRKVEFRSIAPFSQEIISNNYDSVVTLNEVNRRFLSCFIVVKGSKIKPKILITRDKEVSGEKNRDVSSDFQESTKTSEESALDFNMTYTLRSNSYADYNNAKLTCAAEIPKLKPVSTRVTVEVKYPPKLNCDALEYRRKVGDKFKIVCKVRANPKADVSLILPKGGNAQDSPDFGLQVHQEKNKHEDEQEINILISEVDADKHYGKYTIKAQNEFGTVDYDFKLIKTQVYKSLVGGGSTAGKLETCKSTMLIILSLVYILLRS